MTYAEAVAKKPGHWKACGLCGAVARHIASHVLYTHVPYMAPREVGDAALRAEREARNARKGI